VYNVSVKRKEETDMKYIVYYDMETGLFYTKEELEHKFANLTEWEITMRFMPCIHYKSRENIEKNS
jgi:hypothetical protein